MAILPQPDWHSADDFKKLGRPRLGVLVTAGNIDSMVNHYTVSGKRRHDDAYSPGNEAGHQMCIRDRAPLMICAART